MVLSCDGPDSLFDSHKLVLSMPFSDSKRVGVFCARGEWLLGCFPPCPAHPLLPKLFLLLYTSPIPSTSSVPPCTSDVQLTAATYEGGSKMSPISQRRPLGLRLKESSVSKSHNQLGVERAFEPGSLKSPNPSSFHCRPPPLVRQLGMSSSCTSRSVQAG